jgi:hypothetical protein
MRRPCMTHGQWVVIFTTIACVLMFYTRYNLSVAIVAMVKPSDHNTTLVNATSEVDPVRISLHDQLDWDTNTQSYVLSAYFYGYETI